MKCIVTGGAGFIGSHLVDKLLALGNEVIVIDNFSSGKRDNLKQHEGNPKLSIVEKDICKDDIESCFEGNPTVFHLAAIVSVQYSIQNPEETDRVNVGGTLRILEICRKKRVKRFVYSSSAAVYGNQEPSSLDESLKYDPLSPYALHKVIGEYYCKLYHRLYEIETICLRYFNVFGPRQNPEGGYAALIPKTIRRIVNNESPEVWGDGNQTRDFISVKDIAEANVAAALTNNKEAFGQAFNVGSGESKSVNEIMKILIGDKKIEIIRKPPVIEPRNSKADISKIKRMLNWKPTYSFEEELKKTLESFKDN